MEAWQLAHSLHYERVCNTLSHVCTEHDSACAYNGHVPITSLKWWLVLRLLVLLIRIVPCADVSPDVFQVCSEGNRAVPYAFLPHMFR